MTSLTQSCTLSWDKTSVRNEYPLPKINPLESSESVAKRQEFLNKALESIDTLYHDYSLSIHKKVLSGISEFILNSVHNQGQGLPCALVFGGINASDHAILFDELSKSLKQKHQFVAQLYSKDCPTLKNLSKTLIEQFMNLDRDIMDELPTPATLNQVLSFQKDKSQTGKLPNYDFELLQAWYTSISQSHHPQLVIILPDFESFDSNILTRFILILNEFYPQLPLVLVITIATTMESFTSSLPSSCLTCLTLSQFATNPSNEIMNGLVEKCFLESCTGLKFNYECMDYLLQQYQLHDLSVSKFISCIKYALMNHYSRHPLCLLIDFEEDEKSLVNADILSVLQPWHLDHVRSLPCFKEYINSLIQDNYRADAIQFLTNNDYLKRNLIQILTETFEFHASFNTAFKCFYKLKNMVNHPAYRLPLRTLYKKALKGTLLDDIETLMVFIRNKPLEDLMGYLDSFIEILSNGPEFFNPTIEQVEKFILDYKENFVDSMDDTDEDEQDEQDEQVEQVVGQVHSSIQGLEDSQIKIHKPRMTKTSKRTEVIIKGIDLQENIKTERGFHLSICLYLDRFFRYNLKNVSQVFFYNVFYYCNVDSLILAHSPQPRAVIKTGLAHPETLLLHYSNHIQEMDSTIMYTLYQECGKLINLYDWLYAFSSLVDPENELDPKEIQARFMKVSTEFQFMGLVKPTERKTDHVERLTWGI